MKNVGDVEVLIDELRVSPHHHIAMISIIQPHRTLQTQHWT